MWIDSLRSPILIMSLMSIVASGGATNSYEARLTELLQDAVTDDGFVDYNALRTSHNDDFQALLGIIREYDGALDTESQKKAFWINAYNLHMLSHIVEHPEVRNIVDDGFADSFFKSPLVAAQLELSLDEIEHGMLRRQTSDIPPKYRVDELDPRIHVALNCAAVSCPALAREAYKSVTVDSMLDARMRLFVNSERHFRMEDDTFVISSLIDWFADDWDSTGMPAGDYLLGYMSAGRKLFLEFEALLSGKSALEIRDDPAVRFEYLWIVNDIDLR